jgi:hypothetical protein
MGAVIAVLNIGALNPTLKSTNLSGSAITGFGGNPGERQVRRPAAGETGRNIAVPLSHSPASLGYSRSNVSKVVGLADVSKDLGSPFWLNVVC